MVYIGAINLSGKTYPEAQIIVKSKYEPVYENDDVILVRNNGTYIIVHKPYSVKIDGKNMEFHGDCFYDGRLFYFEGENLPERFAVTVDDNFYKAAMEYYTKLNNDFSMGYNYLEKEYRGIKRWLQR